MCWAKPTELSALSILNHTIQRGEEELENSHICTTTHHKLPQMIFIHLIKWKAAQLDGKPSNLETLTHSDQDGWVDTKTICACDFIVHVLNLV